VERPQERNALTRRRGLRRRWLVDFQRLPLQELRDSTRVDGLEEAVLEELLDARPASGAQPLDRRVEVVLGAAQVRLRAAASAPTRSSPTRTPRGAIALPSRCARAAGSTAASSIWPSAPPPTLRSRGNVRTVGDNESIRALPLIDKATRRASAGSPSTRPRLDKGDDLLDRSTASARRATYGRSSRFADPRREARCAQAVDVRDGEWRFAGSRSKRGAS
jgi:hypothetical protein